MTLLTLLSSSSSLSYSNSTILSSWSRQTISRSKHCHATCWKSTTTCSFHLLFQKDYPKNLYSSSSYSLHHSSAVDRIQIQAQRFHHYGSNIRPPPNNGHLFGRCRHQSTTSNTTSTCTSNYSMGFGWTGALGTGSLATNQEASEEEFPLDVYNDENVYYDNNEDDDEEAAPDSHFEQSGLIPILSESKIIAAACGWGHTAVIVQNTNEHTNTSTNQLLMSGRPHDFQSLLRLRRLPAFVRDAAVQISLYYDYKGDLEHTNATSLSSSLTSLFFSKDIDSTVEKDKDKDKEESVFNLPSNGSIWTNFTPVLLPDPNDQPIHIEASAGLSLILGSSGTLYSMGLNHHGQAGIGKMSNNVWTPTPIVVQSKSISDDNDDDDNKNHPSDTPKFQSMACGLQHSLAIDTNGLLYSWGKGTRGQLGHGDSTSSEFAKTIMAFHTTSTQHIPVTHCAAGFNHSTCVTSDNRAWIWGKNVMYDDVRQKVVDSSFPIPIQGLPSSSSIDICSIACGSHHTSILLQDGSVYALGIATDNHEPILEQAVCILPPNSDFCHGNVKQFTCGFDRTTLISKTGNVVKEIQLWSQDELREYADVTPACVSFLRQYGTGTGVGTKATNIKSGEQIQGLYRGWQHSLLIAE